MGFSGWWVSLALLLAATPYTLRSSEAQDEESFTRNYEEDMNEILKVAVQKFLPLISDVITRPEVSGDCSSALLKTFRGLQQRKAWALRMAMSNALFAPNALEGTYVNMGGYEQCLRARVRSSSGELYFKGQYCSLFFALPKDYYTKIIESFHEIGELQRVGPDVISEERGEHRESADSHRFITVPAAILIFAAFILPLLGSGPADEDTYMQMINGCIRNWWTVLVHTNNFNPDGEIHLWYVSADLQIFVFIAFPLGLMLLKFPKSACFAAVVVAIAFNGLISFQVYSHNLFYAFTSGTNDVA
ncbi:hypothetical protein IscW_ISCW004907 [Ixodes scapularis]|uniref:Nose resistant-to-fluoxetine protein N-terminal domain-containing protein n=1 Tax=Ixodes scapularis TaxID=6945 RepID=B7PJV2_IXOSC|nr:hypothetical protein IscW_ISCW004907 [Ixodes scapularis]|eukprot:XP_002408706.1 hypothetical protein IscW_ISCW004907 [Ixodes scapularis]